MNTLDIRKAIENLEDESRFDTLKNLNAIKHIGIDEERNVVVLIIEIGTMAGEAEAHLKRQLAKIIKLDLGFNGIKISFQEEKNFQNTFGKTTKFIIVTSEKGGVGTTSVACNLAYSLTRMGKQVGIIDADIYGSGVPKVLQYEYKEPLFNNHNKILPFYTFGMQFISMEFFADEGAPIVWKSSAATNMINNFFYQVNWCKDLDYIIIDLPKGNCDILLTVSSIVPSAEVLCVSTSDVASGFTSCKSALTLQKKHHNIIGVVENMSDKIFGEGGGDVAAFKLDSEVLIRPKLQKPKYHEYLYESDEENGQLYDDLAKIISIRD